MPIATITYTEFDIVAMLGDKHAVEDSRIRVTITPESEDVQNRHTTSATFCISVDLSNGGKL